MMFSLRPIKTELHEDVLNTRQFLLLHLKIIFAREGGGAKSAAGVTVEVKV